MTNPLDQPPQTELIVSQIATWLRDISIDNGYTSDAGRSVSTEDSQQDDGGTPILTVIDTDYQHTGERRWLVTIDIECLFRRHAHFREGARYLLHDIHRALNRPISDWRDINAGVTDSQPNSQTIDKPADGSDYQRAVYSLQVEYSELNARPTAP